MNRIDKTLTNLRANDKKMLSPYITAGDPSPEYTVPLMHAFVKAGADLLEIGIPFSDPMAEGPVIQRAMERALAHGVNCDTVMEMVGEFRKTDQDTPVVIMGYLNPVEQYGYERFAKKAAEMGVDGTILVDLPPEESREIKKIWDDQGLYGIYLCSPTTTPERMSLINAVAKGYLYYVSLKGVTGSDSIDPVETKIEYQKRKAGTELPLMTGFGIKTADMAARISEFADGVIVGAALISKIEEAGRASDDLITAGASLLREMRQAMDNGK